MSEWRRCIHCGDDYSSSIPGNMCGSCFRSGHQHYYCELCMKEAEALARKMAALDLFSEWELSELITVADTALNVKKLRGNISTDILKKLRAHF